MDSPEQDTLVVASETSSPGRLLESGFLCVRQGRSHLLARDSLPIRRTLLLYWMHAFGAIRHT